MTSWVLFTRKHVIMAAEGGEIKIAEGNKKGEVTLTVGSHMVAVDAQDLIEAVNNIRVLVS